MNEEKGMVSQEAVAATSADTGSIMPLAADLSKTQDVTKVSEVSTINSTDQFYMNQSGKFVQVDYSKLADAILGKISSKTYSLDQGTKTLIAAINELNSKSWEISYNELKENDNLNNKTKSGFYRITDDLKAKTIINNPITGIASCSFTMMVLCIQPEHYSTQILVPYANDVDKIYVRKMVNDKWGTWKSFSFN